MTRSLTRPLMIASLLASTGMPAATPSMAQDAAGLATYRNERHGFSLSYPMAQFIALPTKTQMETLGQDAAALLALMRFTSPFNMTGSPTITLPSGFTDRGTPIAYQLVGRHFSEELLVRAGRAYQRVTDAHRKHPRI